MKEVAQRLDADTDALLDRWEGRPDRVIEDIFRVRDLESKDVEPLELTSYQKQLVHALWYGNASTINVLKGRRTGYSFISCAALLLKGLVQPHSFFAITGPSKSQAKDRIEDIYDLIEWSKLDFDLEIDNRDEIELSNGATYMAFAGNPDTSRGADSADVLFIDEMDFLEDQEESMRAFSPFVALGDAKTLEISTPKLENGLFMQDQEAGSPEGENGIISIEQPAFKNADEINVKRSLFAQDVEPSMPYLNIEKAERDRARDPEGFRQEYLCEPVENQYRFLDERTVKGSIEALSDSDYEYGPTVGAPEGGNLVMAVDIAGGGKDDTAIVMIEHVGQKRYLRYHEVVTDSRLNDVGISPANARNPSAIAQRIQQLYRANGVDRVVTDATNIGEGFDSEIRETIGRGVNSFNFSDRKAVAEMWGDVNYGFHNNQITLVDDDKIRDQLLAIVKDKTTKGSVARFSGKDTAPEGKDDLAIAFALAAYPPNISTESKSLTQEKDVSKTTPENNLGSSRLDVETPKTKNDSRVVKRSSVSRNSNRRKDYEPRHAR